MPFEDTLKVRKQYVIRTYLVVPISMQLPAQCGTCQNSLESIKLWIESAEVTGSYVIFSFFTKTIKVISLPTNNIQHINVISNLISITDRNVNQLWLGIIQRDLQQRGTERDFKFYKSGIDIPSANEYWPNRYLPEWAEQSEGCGYIWPPDNTSRFHDKRCENANQGFICEW